MKTKSQFFVLLLSVVALSQTGCALWPKEKADLSVAPPFRGEATPSSNGASDSGVVPASFEATPKPAVGREASSDPQRRDVSYSDEDLAKGDGFTLDDLDPSNIYDNVAAMAGYGPDEAAAQAHLRLGEALFQEATAARRAGNKQLAQSKFADAADEFTSAAKWWDKLPIEEDAFFLKAECLYFTDRYPDALEMYSGLLTKYDNTRYLDTVAKRLFSIGQYWDNEYRRTKRAGIVPKMWDKTQPTFGLFDRAIKAYDMIRMYAPRGDLADDSVMATANAFFDANAFEDAAIYYDTLRNEYPRSEFQGKAHLLGMQAKLRIYQGSSYDETPLKEAKKIADQTLLQFGPELGSERGNVRETRGRIDEELANRDWKRAQFYEKKSYYGSARFHYGELIANYPNTQRAQHARQRMAEIKNLPDSPPDHFEWLGKIFPSGEKKYE